MMDNNQLDWNIKPKGIIDALILTAHPDDETIFSGGTMLYYPNWNWHIVCVTMQNGTPRPIEFERAMASFSKQGVNIISAQTLNKVDENQDLSESDVKDWKASIKDLNLYPDIVFTHNIMGEYGHKHHIALNLIAHELLNNVWDFVYPGDVSITSQPTKTKVNKVQLSSDLLRKKKAIFNDCYVTQSYVWENLSSLMDYEFNQGPEVFTCE